jgi:hypothetical protein
MLWDSQLVTSASKACLPSFIWEPVEHWTDTERDTVTVTEQYWLLSKHSFLTRFQSNGNKQVLIILREDYYLQVWALELWTNTRETMSSSGVCSLWCSFAHLFPIELMCLCVIGVSVSNGTRHNWYRLPTSSHHWLRSGEGKASQMGVKIVHNVGIISNTAAALLTLHQTIHTIHLRQLHRLRQRVHLSSASIASVATRPLLPGQCVHQCQCLPSVDKPS